MSTKETSLQSLRDFSLPVRMALAGQALRYVRNDEPSCFKSFQKNEDPPPHYYFLAGHAKGVKAVCLNQSFSPGKSGLQEAKIFSIV